MLFFFHNSVKPQFKYVYYSFNRNASIFFSVDNKLWLTCYNLKLCMHKSLQSPPAAHLSHLMRHSCENPRFPHTPFVIFKDTASTAFVWLLPFNFFSCFVWFYPTFFTKSKSCNKRLSLCKNVSNPDSMSVMTATSVWPKWLSCRSHIAMTTCRLLLISSENQLPPQLCFHGFQLSPQYHFFFIEWVIFESPNLFVSARIFTFLTWIFL